MDSERFWDGEEEDNLEDDDEVGDIDAFNDETFGNADEWNEDEHEELIAQDEILSGPARSSNNSHHHNNNNNNIRNNNNNNNNNNNSIVSANNNTGNTGNSTNGTNGTNGININDYSSLFNNLHISNTGASAPQPSASGAGKPPNTLLGLDRPGPLPGHSHRSGWSPFGSKDLFGAPVEMPEPPFQSPIIDHHHQQQQQAAHMHDNVYAALIAQQQQLQRNQQQSLNATSRDGGDRQSGEKRFLTVEEIERQFFLESQQAAQMAQATQAAQAAQAAQITQAAQMAHAAHLAQAAQAAQLAQAAQMAQAQAILAAQNEANRILTQAAQPRQEMRKMIYDGPNHAIIQTADGFLREDKPTTSSSFPSSAKTLEDIERDLVKTTLENRLYHVDHDTTTTSNTTSTNAINPQASHFFDKFHTEIQQNISMNNTSNNNHNRRHHQQQQNKQGYRQQENQREREKYGQQQSTSSSSSHHTHHYNNHQKHPNQRDNNYQNNRNNRAIQNARRAPMIVPPQVQLDVIDKSKNLYSLTAMHPEEFFMDRLPTSNDGFLFRNHSIENRNQHDGVLNDKEKNWLVKIQQQIQLQFDNNIEEDYYHILYQMKKGNSLKSIDHNELLNRHLQMADADSQQSSALYSPRQFVGSLGKISVSNVNCPRQLLDMETH